ncbi:MAG: SDR family oxidoreductase [Stappiaceae bacterium]
MNQLNGKTAIVTGASSGIGRAAALLFAAEGAQVVVGARRQHELDTLVSEITDSGGEALALAGDVGDEAFARDLVEIAQASFGKLDIAFNNAGMLGELGEAQAISLTGWQQTIDTNLTGAFLCAKHQLPAMLEAGGGSLVFTSSFVGYSLGMPGMAAYGASKAGLIGLTQCLAAEFGAKGIRVNALLPGGTDTDMAQIFADTPEAIEYVENLHGLKRIATPKEIAKSALFLASDASSFTTGQAFLSDGGVSIVRA